MAGVLVDVLLERLATLALDKIEQEMKLVVGVKQEIKNLTEKLEAIHAVLEDAEQRQEVDASVKLWLNKLNDVSFEMDDVLDEWITKALRRQLEKQEKQSSKALVTNKKKVCFPSPSSCFRFGKVDYPLFLRHEIAAKIKELNERLALIDQNKQSFNFQTTTRAVPQRPKTTSLPHIRTFGRENEKNLIISKLLSESSEENEVPLIIPIVGMGGMGKTTLAQLVYNDEDVKSHFDSRIWVCVSDPFEEINIAKAIIEGLDRNSTSNELQTLTQCIYKFLEGKRFLLVLDDVWNPTSQWEELIKALQNGARGSRVLVTTRNENVATFMKATTQMIPLKELSEAFCLSLFYYSADMDESSVSKEFKDIGLEIVKRCDGLPLAAKTLGSLMRNKKTIHEWQAVLKSEIWALKEMQQDVFRPLLLSYRDLTLATKRCILYCAIFPKDYVYNKNHLIELWMSQDYLNAKRSEEMRIVGQNCFDDLVLRSFFQDIDVDDESYGNITCKIHDIVHDFLQYLTENEIKLLEFDASKRKEVSNDKVHHLTLVDPSDSFLDCLLSYKRLRTLTVDEPIHSGQLMFDLIVELKSLRTLTLGRLSIVSIPKKIGELIHLRYLDLSGNSELKELPSVIGSLYNLQTLRLDNCDSLEEIDVRRLINLRHLHLRDCYELRLIKGIEKLRDLQTLYEFRVKGNKLEDLKDLNQLQGSLEIVISGNPKMAENAAILVNKPHLLELRLEFFNKDPGLDREIMNGLEPHPGLESLLISGYGYEGAFSPWLSSLHSLRVLTLTYCDCQVLPSLGKLASLESLTIWGLNGVKKVGVEFLGIEQGKTSSSSIFISFPKLRQLYIRDMESWEEWEGVEEENSEKITIMPCLSELTIDDCDKLKALPDFLWKTPLQKLNISGSPILENLYREEIGEQWAKISHIPNIKVG